MTPADPVVEKSKRPLRQGVGFTFLGAGLFALLNATCFGVLFFNPPSFR